MIKLPLVQCARVQSCRLTEKSCGQRWLQATPLEAEAQYVRPHLRVCIGCDDGKSRAHLGLRHEPREEEDFEHRAMARRAEWSSVSHLLKELHEIAGLGPFEPFIDPMQLRRDIAAMETGLLEMLEWRSAAEIRHRKLDQARREREASERNRQRREQYAEEAARRQQHAPRYPVTTQPVDSGRVTRQFFVAALDPTDPPIEIVVTWVGYLIFTTQYKWACSLKIPGQVDQHFYVMQSPITGLDPQGNVACAKVAVEVIDGTNAAPLVARSGVYPQFLQEVATPQHPRRVAGACDSSRKS